MFKLPFLVIALGSVLCMSSISAEPNKIQEALSKIPLMVDGVMKKIGGGGAGAAVSQIAEMGKKFLGKLGKNRSRRSVRSRYVETSMNDKEYQSVDVRHKSDDDAPQKLQQQVESVCLVKDNEIYWLDMVAAAAIHVMQEMRKVLHGKLVAYQMPNNLYNRTTPAN
ncbi:uncharacterized protein LOC134220412 [Armigeres subalbatus]|uniref:uncharacterized protein LOC134220412 n=1 Tax=Armigeres subalbatus TaxID=124917 RepID=UPI002ED2294D